VAYQGPLRGLVNHKNECYANCALQLLLRSLTPNAVGLLQKDLESIPVGLCYPDAVVATALVEVLVKLAKHPLRQPCDPINFVRVMKRRLYEYHDDLQYDAAEFFTDLLGAIPNFKQLFRWTSTVTLRCNKCNYLSKHEANSMFMWSLPIAGIGSLHECIDRYLDAEDVDWVCDECKNKTTARKAQHLAFGEHVCIALNRFNNDAVKDVRRVEYEPTIMLHSVHDKTEVEYDLTAVICHTGASTTSGHYICFIASENGEPICTMLNDKDDPVDLPSDQMLSLNTAYMLYYTVCLLCFSILVS
jgi:uncharacterized UBP type Zn finger protein